jgi:ATP/ADP translocase
MRTYLIISQIVYLLALLPWLLFVVISPMVLDAGVSTWNVTYVLTILLYPIAVIICSILAWIFRRKRRKVSIYVNLIPFLLFLAAFALLSMNQSAGQLTF